MLLLIDLSQFVRAIGNGHRYQILEAWPSGCLYLFASGNSLCRNFPSEAAQEVSCTPAGGDVRVIKIEAGALEVSV